MKLFGDRRQERIDRLSPADRKRYDALTEEIIAAEVRIRMSEITARTMRAEREWLLAHPNALENFLKEPQP